MSEELIAQNAGMEDTTPQEPETQQEVESGAETDTTPQNSESTEDTTAQGTDNSDGTVTQADNAPFLEIQYNHEKRGLSREETVTLAQKGMHYEKSYNILERVATLKGVSVNEFLNGIEKSQDEAYRQSLVEQFGNDENTINSMMELYEIKKQQTLDGAKAKREQEAADAEQSLNERLANEFTVMKSDFPELTDFASLPAAVKKAAGDGMSLSHAYLLYQHKEQQKIAAAKQNAEEAAKKSTGSMHSDGEAENSAIDAMLRGVWN